MEETDQSLDAGDVSVADMSADDIDTLLAELDAAAEEAEPTPAAAEDEALPPSSEVSRQGDQAGLVEDEATTAEAPAADVAEPAPQEDEAIQAESGGEASASPSAETGPAADARATPAEEDEEDQGVGLGQDPAASEVEGAADAPTPTADEQSDAAPQQPPASETGAPEHSRGGTRGCDRSPNRRRASLGVRDSGQALRASRHGNKNDTGIRRHRYPVGRCRNVDRRQFSRARVRATQPRVLQLVRIGPGDLAPAW